MCPYAFCNRNEDGTVDVTCEPKKERCTFCVMGNGDTYKEIEKERSRYAGDIRKDKSETSR
jgi:hypothetical protein